MSRLAYSMSDRTELYERLNVVGRVLSLQNIVIWSIRASRSRYVPTHR